MDTIHMTYSIPHVTRESINYSTHSAAHERTRSRTQRNINMTNVKIETVCKRYKLQHRASHSSAETPAAV
jgi:hypothetical protein